VQTKRVRDRLKRKHPRSEELLGSVQRWATSLDLHRAIRPQVEDGDLSGAASERQATAERRKIER